MLPIRTAITSLFLVLIPVALHSQGDFWVQVGDGFGSRGVGPLVIDADGRIYAPTWGKGVVRSDDEGKSWQRYPVTVAEEYLNTVAVSPNGSPPPLFAGHKKVNIAGGVWKSADRGESWTNVLNLDNVYVLTIISGGFILAGTPDGVYRSKDYGNNWTLLSLITGVYSLTFNWQLELFAGSINQGIFRSTDEGGSWTQINQGLKSNNEAVFAILTDDSGNILIGTRNGIYKSTNNGDSWASSSTGMPGDVQVIALADNSNGYVFASTNGFGVYLSTDQGANWSEMSSGLRNLNVFGLTFDQKGFLYAGADSGYIFKSKNTTIPVAGRVKFIVAPGDGIAGDPLTPNPVMELQDLSGLPITRNFTVELSTIDDLGDPVVPGVAGSYDLTNGSVSPGTLSIQKAGGPYRLIAQYGTAYSDTSDTFHIRSRPIDQNSSLAWVDEPGDGQVNAALAQPPRLQFRDKYGNSIDTSGVDVRLLPGNKYPPGASMTNFTEKSVTGIATFSSLEFDRAGEYTIVAISGLLSSPESKSFVISEGGATRVEFVQNPGNAVIGKMLSPQPSVAIKDVNGNTIFSSNATITLEIGNNPGGGVLSGTAAVTAINGIATFSDLSIDKAGGGYTLIARSFGLASDTSLSFDVLTPAASKLVFLNYPGNSRVYEAFPQQPVVAVTDGSGNTISGSSAEVSLVIGDNPGGGTLSGTATMSAVNGIATFSGLAIDKPGFSYTLSASSPGLTPATSPGFPVSAGAAERLLFATHPGDGKPGQEISQQPVVEIVDQWGNVVSNSGVAVTVSIGNNPAAGTLSGTISVAAVNGVARFAGLTVDRSGKGYTLTANSTGLSSDESQPFNISTGEAEKLGFSRQPAGAIAGALLSQQPSVVVLDDVDQTVGTSNASVTVSLGQSPGGATLSGTKTVQAVNGQASFTDLSIDMTGSYSLVATSGVLTQVESDLFSMSGGQEVGLKFITQPGGASVTDTLSPQPVVAVVDNQDRIVSTSGAAITLAIGNNPGSGTLQGNGTVIAVDGVATFSNLRIDKAGADYTLVASSTGLASATSTNIRISSGAAHHLHFTTEPGTVSVGAAFDPPLVVEIQDAENNTVTSSAANVSLSIGNNPGSGVLSGTTQEAATNGVARFTGVSLNQPGAGYTLIATSPSLVSASSTPFTVTSSGMTVASYSGNNQSGTINTALTDPFIVQVTDDQSQPVQGVQVGFSGNYPPGSDGASLSNSGISTDINGRASTVLTLGNRIGTYIVSASVSGAAGTPANFTATATSPPYPTNYALNHTYQFPYYEDPGRYGPNEYKIIGLPGNPGISIVDLLQGVQNTDWKLFTDNGAVNNYHVAYDGSSTFHASAGRGFLLLHRGAVTVNRSVPVASLESGNIAHVPLHDNWNLITNPFDMSISWEKIQRANGITDPIWSYQQSFSQAGTFDPYVGYYFYNSKSLPSLRVPYDSGFSVTGTSENSLDGWSIEAKIRSSAYVDGGVRFGVREGAGDEFDRYDVRKPMIPGRKVSSYFLHPEWNIRHPVFASDIRPDREGVQIWEPVIELSDNTPAEVVFSGVWRVPANLEIRLFRSRNSAPLDLRKDSTIFLEPAGPVRRLTIAVGTREELNRVFRRYTPEQPVLTEGYPNPAISGSRVAVLLNREMSIRLSVHDIYGRELRTLYHGALMAGQHVFEWKGNTESGMQVSSGLYLFRMTAEDGTQRIRRIIYTR